MPHTHFMSPLSDRDDMVRQMDPALNPGEWVFIRTNTPLPQGIQPLMTFREDEGLTAIMSRDTADTHELTYDLITAWLTLRVASSLEGVGLTAAVSSALADHGIACNIVAAFTHDHLFVPARDANRALDVLQTLACS